MNKAIHFPGLLSSAICIEHGSKPSVTITALACCKFKEMGDCGIVPWVVHVPKHRQYPLLHGTVLLSTTLAGRIGKDRRVLHWGKLPEVARKQDIDAAKRSGVSPVHGVAETVWVSETCLGAQKGFQGSQQAWRERAALVDNQKAKALRVLKELVPVNFTCVDTRF